MATVLAEHFVALSAKLGGAGYIGPRGQHLQDLHRFAQWMFRYEATGGMDRGELIMTEQFERVNAIVSASARAGFWVQSMDDLVSFSSSEVSHSRGGSGRSLLGNCGAPSSECGNECFGMCGAECSCWSWVCGDCDCWAGCHQHD